MRTVCVGTVLEKVKATGMIIVVIIPRSDVYIIVWVAVKYLVIRCFKAVRWYFYVWVFSGSVCWLALHTTCCWCEPKSSLECFFKLIFQIEISLLHSTYKLESSYKSQDFPSIWTAWCCSVVNLWWNLSMFMYSLLVIFHVCGGDCL